VVNWEDLGAGSKSTCAPTCLEGSKTQWEGPGKKTRGYPVQGFFVRVIEVGGTDLPEKRSIGCVIYKSKAVSWRKELIRENQRNEFSVGRGQKSYPEVKKLGQKRWKRHGLWQKKIQMAARKKGRASSTTKKKNTTENVVLNPREKQRTWVKPPNHFRKNKSGACQSRMGTETKKMPKNKKARWVLKE